jgi:RNA polymerase sigma-70 factor, ECF subfamily
MALSMSDGTEEEIRVLIEGGDLDLALQATLRKYGAEIVGFLAGVMDEPDLADDVFSAFSQRLWKGLGGFRWQCSLRTWCYTVARNELARHRAGAAAHKARHIGLSTAGSIPGRPALSPHPLQRSSFLDAFVRLRSSLAPDDRQLLVLRVDRNLPWRDLALLFLDAETTPEELSREAARLRKRFQLVKRQLARAAADSGLLTRR